MAVTFRNIVLFIVAWSCVVVLMHWQLVKISDFRLKAILLRAEYVIVIESFLTLNSFIVWKTLSPFLVAQKIPNSSSRRLISSPIILSRPRLREKKNSDTDLSTHAKEHNDNSWSMRPTTWTVWHYVLLTFFVLSHMSYVTNYFLIRADPHWFSFLCYTCLGIQLHTLIGIVFIKCFSYLISISKEVVSPKCHCVEQFLSKKNRAIIVIFYVLFVSMVGLYTASQPPKVKQVTIPVQDLPEHLRGLHIVQLSDIHLGPTVGYTKLKMIFDIVKKENPDILVLTGDLVDGPVTALREAAQPLKSFNPKYGKLFVSGNHEYYTGDVDNWFVFLRTLGFDVLHNSNIQVPQKISSGERQICFAGTDDIRADDIGYGNDHTFDVKKAVKGCDEDGPVILLAHQPIAAKKALNSGVRLDVILSGHTHGGQMFPMMIPAYFTNPFFTGLYKIEGRHTHIYVSAGTQYWGIPMRIATSMEITSIRLQPL